MNFKALLTTVALTTTTLFGGVAEAVQQDRIGYNEPGALELYTALRNTGVTIDIEDCNDGMMGWYIPTMNDNMGGIIICSDGATTHADQWETLRHEAVHAAQHCRDWDDVMVPGWLQQNLTRADKEFVEGFYTPDEWQREYEAFALEHHTNYQIAQLVDHHCSGYQM